MRMSVDQPRNNRLARKIDAGRTGRNLDRGRRTDCFDDAIVHNDCSLLDCRAARAVDDARTRKRDDAGTARRLCQ